MIEPNPFSKAVPVVVKKIAPASVALASCLMVVSCGGFDAVGIVKKPFKSVAKIKLPRLMPQRIPIAEVRAKDLREMPTGAEKALAFEEKRNRRRFVFIPGFYKEPKLPDARSLPSDAGILPPLRRSTD